MLQHGINRLCIALTFVSLGCHAVDPVVVDNSTIFPGKAGCRDSTYNKCITGGDSLQDPCVALADGSHYCNCTAGFQVYSDGVCKAYPDPCDAPIGLKGADSCAFLGDVPGTCVADANIASGFTCSCPSGSFVGLSPFDGCYSDPCAFDPCNGGTCTAQDADTTTYGYPYMCTNCPAGTTFFDGNCYDPCANAGCAGACTVDTTHNTGYICSCASTQAFDGATCVDSCNDPGFTGLADCMTSGETVNDTAAVCYATDVSPSLYFCSCSAGFVQEFNPSTQTFHCVDLNECSASATPCGEDPSATCTNSVGSYSCVCSAGFIQTSSTICTDVDECNNSTNPCGTEDLTATCSNTAGSFTCTCSAGFQLTDTGCVDIDECFGASVCGTDDTGAVCTNTPGSYSCLCSSGFEASAAGCVDIDECLDTSICGTDGSVCTNTLGSYSCSCSAGFTLENGVCVDINECLHNVCGISALCTNTKGSYKCSCLPGFKSFLGFCLDINECFLGRPCGPFGQCINTIGSYTCKCPLGQYFAGGCIDNDKCPLDACGPNSKCIRTKFGIVCSCLAGFRLVGGKCADIDECSTLKKPCGTALCSNTPGSFSCKCPDGSAFISGTCKALTPCQYADRFDGNPCNNHSDKKAKCDSGKKNYSCNCSHGFKFRDGESCKKDGQKSAEEGSSEENHHH